MDLNTIVNIVLIAILGFFAFFGFFFGLCRGLKKTTFRTIWLLLSMVVLIFVVPLITNAIVDAPINVSIDIPELNITTISTLRETINTILTHFIGVDIATEYPALSQIILAIPVGVLNLVLFILLFFIAKIVLLPLSAIIYGIFFGEKKQKKQKLQKKSKNSKNEPIVISEKPKKKSKHRFIGAITGTLTGVVVSFAILMPIVSISDMMAKNNVGKLLEEEANNAVISEYITAYNNSIVATIYNTTGLTHVANFTFDKLTTVNTSDGKKLSLVKDVPIILDTYAKANAFAKDIATYMGENNDFKNLTKEEVSDLLNKAQAILQKAKTISFVDSINDLVIPLVVDYIEAKDIRLNEDEGIHNAMIATLDNLAVAIKVDHKNINVIDELCAIIDIARFINDNDLLIPMLATNTESITNAVKNLDNNFATTLSEKLFALQTVNVTAPNLVNLGVVALNRALNISMDEDHTVTTDTIKNTFASVVQGALDIFKSLSFTAETVGTTDLTLESIGRLLDNVKNSTIISTVTYESLIDYALDTLEKTIEPSAPADFKAVFGKLFDVLPTTIKNVTSFEADLKKVNSALKLMTSDTGILAPNGFDAKNKDHMITLGKTLDVLATTQLLGAKVNLTYVESEENQVTQVPFVSYILYHAMDDIKPILESNLVETGYDFIIDSLSDIQMNIVKSNYDPATNPNFFESEFTNLAPVVNLVQSLGGEEGETSIVLDAETGKILDSLRKTKLVGNKVTNNIIAGIIDTANDSIEGSDATMAEVKNVLTNVSLRLKSEQILTFMDSDPDFWETELQHINSLMNIDFTGDNIIDSISTIGATIDDIVKINLVPDAIRPSVLLQENDFRDIIATTIESLSSTILSSMGNTDSAEYTAVNNAITSIVANYKAYSGASIVVIDSFEKELSHITTLKGINPNVFGAQNSNGAKDLGEKLDSIAYNTNANDNSKTITKAIIDKILVDCLDLINGNTGTNYIDTAIADIKSNVNKVYNNTLTIPGWTQELVHLYNITKLESATNGIGSSVTSFTTEKATQIGEILDGIVFNYASTSTTKDTDKNSKIISSTAISTLVDTLLSQFKVDSGSASTTESITNDLLSKLESTSAEYIIDYNSSKDNAYLYTTAFTELAYISEQMNDSELKNAIDNPSLSSLTNTVAEKIDSTLENIQTTKLSGAVTTRKIAKTILEKIAGESYREIASYANALYSHYTTNATSTENESYYDTQDSSTYEDTTNFKNAFQKVLAEFKAIPQS